MGVGMLCGLGGSGVLAAQCHHQADMLDQPLACLPGSVVLLQSATVSMSVAFAVKICSSEL